MAQQDWLQARHVVHTLKGVAATLGAQAVEAQCAQLEHGLQAAQPQASQLEPLALTLGHTLGTLIRAISQAELPLEARSVSHTNHHTPAATHQETRDNTAELAPGVAQALPPAQELADEQGLERLRTIIKLARESDASALDMMQEHCENLEKIWPQATQRAVELLSNYDFPEAADVLEAAIQAKP
jgi:HPt (histidine-containing phosphotransfer) domain-containing protein